MRHRQFGSTKREVAIVGQGTWYGKEDSRESAVLALRRGLDLGMTHVDTAEMYLSGRAEEWVSEAIQLRRQEVFLVSKVLPQNASRKGTVSACEGSLSRLKTDRLDCYLLHWRGDYPLDDTIEAFQQLQSEGKILSWGVSNFDAPDLKGSPSVKRVRRAGMQSGSVSPAGAGGGACRRSLVRKAWRRVRCLQSIWARRLSRPAYPRRPPVEASRRGDHGNPAPGCAPVFAALALLIRDSKIVEYRSRYRKCRRRRP